MIRWYLEMGKKYWDTLDEFEKFALVTILILIIGATLIPLILIGVLATIAYLAI